MEIVTKKSKVELSYRQWMRIVNYYSNAVCGFTTSHISDWCWRDEFYENTTTLENHINSACDAFETFLQEVEPSHYNVVVMEFPKLTDKLLKDENLLSQIVA